MDVSKFQLQGEWLELKVKSKKKEKSLKLRIHPLSSDEQIDLGQAAKGSIKKFLSKIHDLVLGWDLTKDNQDLPCNTETKKAYLPYLVNMKLQEDEIEATESEDKEKEEEKPAIRTVGLAILEFAQNFDNFIKN